MNQVSDGSDAIDLFHEEVEEEDGGVNSGRVECLVTSSPRIGCQSVKGEPPPVVLVPLVKLYF